MTTPAARAVSLPSRQVKRCSRCSVMKPTAAFHVRRRSPDGRNAACKACILAKRHAEWDERLAVEGRERVYRRPVVDGRKQCTLCREWKRIDEHRAGTNQCIACRNQIESTRSFRKRNGPGKQLVLFGTLESEQRQRAIARALAWNRAHPEVRRALIRQRRARLGGKTRPGLTRTAIAERMVYFGNRCWICGGVQEQVDHVKPVSAGGAHLLCNLRPICGACNRHKSGRWPYHVGKGIPLPVALEALATVKVGPFDEAAFRRQVRRAA